MPKKGGKGGKKGRRGKGDGFGQKRELIYKEEGQEYAQITKMLGNGRVEASCYDGIKRMAHIRGKLRKKVWMAQGDIILVSLRDFQDEQCDVVHKYNVDEARALKAQGELPMDAKINETDMFAEEDGDVNFEFGDADEDDEEEEEELDIDDI
ncbi:Eukaryotic translation initiation factor 1A Short=EIF-1A; AltName: Full=EIF-4C [Cyberlindnera jadinii]|uniref:Eukaryotic translation initiation factor 4C n=1 Tax=Cyberlindnera jadinii (strain ATCC 18201 / CBS 1600 / BCRC 20928 / JCM 3617 / NBRC 0987 / NRRL Y-1542) TaxID=983966 RepID=A0A0H5CBV0_CYBJN